MTRNNRPLCLKCDEPATGTGPLWARVKLAKSECDRLLAESSALNREAGTGTHGTVRKIENLENETKAAFETYQHALAAYMASVTGKNQ